MLACLGYDTKLYLIVSLHLWSFGECGQHRHDSHIHSYSKWLYTLRSHL